MKVFWNPHQMKRCFFVAFTEWWLRVSWYENKEFSLLKLKKKKVTSCQPQPLWSLNVPWHRPIPHLLFLGPRKKTQELKWVRIPSICNMKLAFSKLTPIHFFKNIVSMGCSLHPLWIPIGTPEGNKAYSFLFFSFIFFTS